jgi:hypothetical protein
MPLLGFIGTVGVYVVLALLLLSLNVFSLWKWWIKAGAIVVTTACFVIAYVAISALIGWPSRSSLPPRFSVLATRIEEPNRLTGAAGHIYLWVEELNANAVPDSPPRGYELPYTPQLADDTDAAQQKINSGEKVMGQSQPSGGKKTAKAPPNESDLAGSNMSGKQGKGTQLAGQSVAAETIGEAQIIVYSNMPAVTLPDKANTPTPPAD